MEDITMSLEDMISTLDGAAGRLIVAAMHDPVIKDAMEMITKVSLSLGEVDSIVFYNYDDENNEEED